MKLAARFFLIITGVLLLAHYLPAGFWLLADNSQRAPYVFYSCVTNKFLFYRFGKGEQQRVDTTGLMRTLMRSRRRRSTGMGMPLMLFGILPSRSSCV